MRYTIRRVDDQHTVVEAYGFISSPVVYSTVLCFAAPVGVRGGGAGRGPVREYTLVAITPRPARPSVLNTRVWDRQPCCRSLDRTAVSEHGKPRNLLRGQFKVEDVQVLLEVGPGLRLWHGATAVGRGRQPRGHWAWGGCGVRVPRGCGVSAPAW